MKYCFAVLCVCWVYLIVGQLGRIYSDECDKCSLLRAEGNIISISLPTFYKLRWTPIYNTVNLAIDDDFHVIFNSLTDDIYESLNGCLVQANSFHICVYFIIIRILFLFYYIFLILLKNLSDLNTFINFQFIWYPIFYIHLISECVNLTTIDNKFSIHWREILFYSLKLNSINLDFFYLFRIIRTPYVIFFVECYISLRTV